MLLRNSETKVMIWRFVLLVLTVCLVFLVSSEKNSKRIYTSCYDQQDNPYLLFSSKTAYRVNQNKDRTEIVFPGCEAKKFWLLSRHGTRNPGTKDMKKLQQKLPVFAQQIKLNHRGGKGQMCPDDIENLEDWKFIANITEDKYLVDEGFRELKGLGGRFQSRFPSLLTRPFVNSSYVFKFTDSERTDDSAKAYARGMFGKKDVSNVYMLKSQYPDKLLRFYKACNKWLKEVDENPEATIEKKKFERTPEFLSMINSVSLRLGFEKPLELSDVDLMYTMCSFDKAWRFKELSPWCAVFSQDDLEILEYREDLEYFYEDGYGFSVNYEQACVPLNDLFEIFRKTVEEEVSAEPKGYFYFTHSGTMLKVLARLGLFKDDVRPVHSNRLQVTTRAWRTSLIDSFATNLAFVLFKCSNRYSVAAYFQEQLIQLPGCSQTLCDFQDFVRQYGSLASNCNLDSICRL